MIKVEWFGQPVYWYWTAENLKFKIEESDERPTTQS
jgi:hypothetical protein